MNRLTPFCWLQLALSALLALGLAVRAGAEEPAQRIVSVGGSVTEIVYALGQEHRLVARDTTSNAPAAALELPDVGYVRRLSPEGLLSVNPDLILAEDGAGPPEALEVLRDSRIPLITVPMGFDRAAVRAKIETVAGALDNAAELPPVLLVEDNEINREVLGQQLKRIGLRVVTAVNGAEGLQFWREGDFPLVLTDCHMPMMDGFEMTTRIREIEHAEGRPRTAIVAITANTLAGEAQRCLSHGMDDYLSKPVRVATLRETVLRWAAGTMSRHDLAVPASLGAGALAEEPRGDEGKDDIAPRLAAGDQQREQP